MAMYGYVKLWRAIYVIYQLTGNHYLMLTPRTYRITAVNGPFYRYGGHFELIRFKEYYIMPRGHEHISLVFSGVFRFIFP